MASSGSADDPVVPGLDDVLDACNNGVPKHLGKIADTVSCWEGPLSEELGLTVVDVNAIKTKHPTELKLQT